MRRSLHTTLALLTITLFAVSTTRSQTAHFDDPTDTILVEGQTVFSNQATLEVILLVPETGAAGGIVFNEWTNGQEDKLVSFSDAGAGASNLAAGAWPFTATTLPQAVVTVAPNAWHHVAYVYDGAEERLYFDGERVVVRQRTSGIANSTGVAHVGALLRPTLFESFQGYLESIRLSDVPRYAGESFTPPLGDLSSDANTVLLYNFDEPAGSPTVADGSPLGRTGMLGAGFSGATAPRLAPRPVSAEPPLSTQSAFLGKVRPNPFSASTELPIIASVPVRIHLALYDALGREVSVLVDEAKSSGRHPVQLLADGLTPGVYFVRLSVDGAFTQSTAIIRTR